MDVKFVPNRPIYSCMQYSNSVIGEGGVGDQCIDYHGPNAPLPQSAGN